MRPTWIAASALVVIGTLRGARAEPEAEHDHTTPTLPSLSIRADDKGTAKLAVGVDVATPITPSTDLGIKAEFSTTTVDGVANLFTFGGAGASARDFAISAQFTLVQLEPLASTPIGGSLDEQQFGACEKACTPTSDEDFCLAVYLDANQRDLALAKAAMGIVTAAPAATTDATGAPTAPLPLGQATQEWITTLEKRVARGQAFRAAVVNFKPGGVPADKLCTAGVAVLTEFWKRERDRQLSMPRTLLSAGFSAGQTRQSFLRADASTGLFTPADEKTGAGAIALSAMYRVPSSGVTFELPLRIGFRSASPGPTARWCEPAGQVVTSGGPVPAEACDERSEGAPVATTTFRAAPLLGIVKQSTGSFRVAIGPFVDVSDGDTTKATIAGGMQLPLYLNTQLLPASDGIWKGILRITPSITRTWDRQRDTKATEFLLSVELLTGRSLFANALDL